MERVVNSGTLKWAPEHDTEARERAADGCTGREVAAAINHKFGTGYSRNAAIGRMHRLGITKPRVVQNANRRAVKQIAKREQERTKPREPIAPNLEPVRVAWRRAALSRPTRSEARGQRLQISLWGQPIHVLRASPVQGRRIELLPGAF